MVKIVDILLYALQYIDQKIHQETAYTGLRPSTEFADWY